MYYLRTQRKSSDNRKHFNKPVQRPNKYNNQKYLLKVFTQNSESNLTPLQQALEEVEKKYPESIRTRVRKETRPCIHCHDTTPQHNMFLEGCITECVSTTCHNTAKKQFSEAPENQTYFSESEVDFQYGTNVDTEFTYNGYAIDTRFINMETKMVQLPKRCKCVMSIYVCDNAVGLYAKNTHIGTQEKSSPCKPKVRYFKIFIIVANCLK
jgi:hypothetical protein